MFFFVVLLLQRSWEYFFLNLWSLPYHFLHMVVLCKNGWQFFYLYFSLQNFNLIFHKFFFISYFHLFVDLMNNNESQCRKNPTCFILVASTFIHFIKQLNRFIYLQNWPLTYIFKNLCSCRRKTFQHGKHFFLFFNWFFIP